MYAVALTEVSRGKAVRTALVCTPASGNWNHVASGTRAEAEALCVRMRSRPVLAGASRDCAYTVVPVPTAG